MKARARESGVIGIPDLVYPDSDGEPMSDNQANVKRMVDLWESLEEAFRRRDEKAFVGTDMFVYPVEGEPWTKNSPDCLVAPGCDSRRRPSFKYWEENGTVEFAGEFLSVLKEETFESDAIRERIEFYRAKLGTREVFVYEPLGEDMDSGFRFFFLRLGKDGRYRQVKPRVDGWYRSAVLPLHFRPVDEGLEVRDAETHEHYLPDGLRAKEEEERADLAEERADRAEERADRAEERVRDLEREIEKLRESRRGSRID